MLYFVLLNVINIKFSEDEKKTLAKIIDESQQIREDSWNGSSYDLTITDAVDEAINKYKDNLPTKDKQWVNMIKTIATELNEQYWNDIQYDIKVWM